ncbi:hypothetical protein NXX98_16760 [Bacteroides thetaiotaomicron]|uniref:hypothetical protein n=1 Tax=Bacteroides thetaiotaomicron TaxID=818 RepID=UPI00286D89AE|nr:hypothetical protein [Bacteroides thetaiotaomicron]MCS3009503.1 hypothetical protein [Bacteroides thetaiotaomicron]
MDNRNELRLKMLVDTLNNTLEATDKKQLINLMAEIIQVVELLKWEERYNNTDPFMFVD